VHPFATRSALVTGASSGLGAEFARQLAGLGVSRLILVARREDRLRELQAELAGKHPGLHLDLMPVDLGSEMAVTGFLQTLERTGSEPDILISNAGFGDLGTLESSEAAKIELMLAVNVVALTRLTHWIVPRLLRKRAGWICHVGSSAGMLPLPTFAVYAATKAYVNSFSEAVRVELHGSGVSVLALCPGPVETEFGQVASRPTGHRRFAPPAFLCVSREKVVQQTLDALSRGHSRLIPGLLVRLGILLTESTPRCILRFIFNLGSGQFRAERAQAERK
jgi:short-subunit dehydrogenase